MKLFSDVMGLSQPQNGFEFFDLDTTTDTRLFIDPYYFVHLKHNSFINEINKTVATFITELLVLVKSGNRVAANKLCAHFGETKGTGLGYSCDKINGNGAGKTLSSVIVDSLFASNTIALQHVSNVEDFMIVCEGVAKDRVSDIVLSIGRKGFIEFTQDQCKKLRIPMKKTDEQLSYYCPKSKCWKSDYFDLPHIVDPLSLTEQYIILVPEKLLTEKVIYNFKYFLTNVVIPAYKEDAIKRNLSIVKIRKNGKRYVTNDDLFQVPEYKFLHKDDAVNFIANNPESLEYFRRSIAPFIFDRLQVA